MLSRVRIIDVDLYQSVLYSILFKMVWQLCFLLTCTPAGRTSDSMTAPSDLKTYLLMRWLGPDAASAIEPTEVLLLNFFCSIIQLYVLLSPYLCFISFLYLDLYALGNDSWIS